MILGWDTRFLWLVWVRLDWRREPLSLSSGIANVLPPPRCALLLFWRLPRTRGSVCNLSIAGRRLTPSLKPVPPFIITRDIYFLCFDGRYEESRPPDAKKGSRQFAGSARQNKLQKMSKTNILRTVCLGTSMGTHQSMSWDMKNINPPIRTNDFNWPAV